MNDKTATDTPQDAPAVGGRLDQAVGRTCPQRAEARQAALEKDAARYRWLKSRQGLTLRSEKQPNVWKRMDGTEFSATHSLAEGGTQHAPADSMDALIDAAMLAARIRDA